MMRLATSIPGHDLTLVGSPMSGDDADAVLARTH